MCLCFARSFPALVFLFSWLFLLVVSCLLTSWILLTVPTAVCHHNVLVLVALGPRARAPKKSLENTFPRRRRARGPSISNLRQTKIVPKGQRLHVTEVPNSFGSQVEHGLKKAVKNHIFQHPQAQNIAYSGVLLQSDTHPQADQGGIDQAPCQNCLLVQRAAIRPFVPPCLPPRAACFVQMSAPPPPHPL